MNKNTVVVAVESIEVMVFCSECQTALDIEPCGPHASRSHLRAKPCAKCHGAKKDAVKPQAK